MHLAEDQHHIISVDSTRRKLGNPAVVGLAGFGLTTLVLQFHNIGWMAPVGPVICLGLIFGGAAQLFAGMSQIKGIAPAFLYDFWID